MAVSLRDDTFTTVRTDWRDDNGQGLSHATAGEWLRATESFHKAVQGLTRISGAMDFGSDEQDALGLTIANLAHAAFRAGRTLEALDYAQQAIEVRSEVSGAGSMPVLRARMDRAVMLATAGHLSSAQRELADVINGIESHGGLQDARLAVPLENAARVALALGEQETARAFATRLRDVLAMHGLATSRATRLLDRTRPPMVFHPAASLETVELVGRPSAENPPAPMASLTPMPVATPVAMPVVAEAPSAVLVAEPEAVAVAEAVLEPVAAPIAETVAKPVAAVSAPMMAPQNEVVEEIEDDEDYDDEEDDVEPLMGSSEILRAIIAETEGDPDGGMEMSRQHEQAARKKAKTRTTRSMQRVEPPAESSPLGNILFGAAFLALIGAAIAMWISSLR